MRSRNSSRVSLASALPWSTAVMTKLATYFRLLVGSRCSVARPLQAHGDAGAG